MKRLRVLTHKGQQISNAIKRSPERIYGIASELSDEITIAAEGEHYVVVEGVRAVLIERHLMKELHDVYEEVEFVANMGHLPGRDKRNEKRTN